MDVQVSSGFLYLETVIPSWSLMVFGVERSKGAAK